MASALLALSAGLGALPPVGPVTGGPGGPSGPSGPSGTGSLDDLQRWTERVLQRTSPMDEEREDELRWILVGTREVARSGREGQRSVILALLDLFGAGVRLGDSLDPDRMADGARLRELARRELRWWLDAPTVRWLAVEVLPRSDSYSALQRAACALALAGEREERLLLALFTCVHESDGIVREAALWGLAGWDEAAVHSLFLRLLLQEDFEAPGPGFAALERHFVRTRLALESPIAGALLTYVRQRMTAPDWRTATHAIAVSAALDTSLVAPLLVDALEVWGQRADAGEPVRRVQQDLKSSLERRSGLRLGANAARWRTWWKGFETGQRPLTNEAPDAPVSEVAFFGIRPLTDRVVFLIDHSGSMAGRIAPTGERSASQAWSRYDEAIEQMLSLLQDMGPRTRFNVVLFDDDAASWHSQLQPATPGNLKAARTWLRARDPDGGTFLRRGFEAAMGVRRDGSLDPRGSEADTLIVLCDGETTDGSAWVRPVMERLQVRARWMVHCVQLGSFGDDSLELLAELTGGEHVRR